jgi:Na+/H+-dicarboxylate symporter
MKTRITYPIAILLGFAASLLLGGWAPYESFLSTIVPVVKLLGIFVLFPVVFTLFMAAVASLRRYKDTLIVFSSTIFWALFTTLVLSFAGMALFLANPFGIGIKGPFTTSYQSNFFDFSTLLKMFFSENAFSQFTLSNTTLLPIMVVALFFGIALRPDKEALRPAYVVVNSFAEVMMRLTRIITIVGALFLLFISAEWFGTWKVTTLFKTNLSLFIGLALAVVAALGMLLPLLFGLFTRFKGGNPYRILFGTFPALLATGFSGSMLYGTTPLLALSQKNNGVRKRALGISVPLLTILGRGGSALVSTMVSLGLLYTLQGALPSIQIMVFIALGSALFSLGAAFSPGIEILFIVLMVFKGFQASAISVIEPQIILLLPILQIIAIIIDAAVIAYGTAFSSRIISTDDSVPQEQMM